MPAVVNATAGGLSDADATAMARGFWNAEALTAFAEVNDESAMLERVANHSPVDTGIITALAEGHKVVDMNCDLYPVSVKVVPNTAAENAWFADFQGQTTAKYDLLMVFIAGKTCGYHIDNGPLVPDPASSTHYPLLVGGVEANDPMLGALFKVDTAATCSAPHAIAADCH